MNLMDKAQMIAPEEAQQRYREYQAAAQATGSVEDEALMRCYREAAVGRRIIDLRETIKAGGEDAKGFPRLAVMRADMRWCWLNQRERDGSVTFACEQRPHHARRHGMYRLPAGTLPDTVQGQEVIFGSWQARYRAMVPVIPPNLRPRHALHNYEILWEVDVWEHMPPPPGDPALLKHIYGWLYAVLAVWDLTPLEQAVLGARTD